MQAGFREKTSLAALWLFLQDKCGPYTVPWALGTRAPAVWLSLPWPGIPTQPHTSSAKGKTGEHFYWHQAVHTRNRNCKRKEVHFGALPHFPDFSSLSWNVLPLLIQTRRALWLPPSWPEAFHLPPDPISSRALPTLKWTRSPFLPAVQISNEIVFD